MSGKDVEKNLTNLM